MENIKEIENNLLTSIETIGASVIAFSGGIDSSVLSLACKKVSETKNIQTLAVTANSESLATGEIEVCKEFTTKWEIPWQQIRTSELDNPNYVKNNTDRCYWCKTALFDGLEPIADQRQSTILLGVNYDDLFDHRPGQVAAQERGARFPLAENYINKQQVRALAKHWGIEKWNKPSSPCLSSRIPHGTEVNVQILSSIDRAELYLKKLGFSDVRVRHYENAKTARIEVPKSQMALVLKLAEQINEELTKIGYKYTTIDLAGLKSGNLNNV